MPDEPKIIPRDKLKEIPEEQSEDICSLCGGELKPEKVNLDQLEKGKLFVIENVDAYVCENCGEVWVPKPVLEEFEKMVNIVKTRKKGGKDKKNV